MSKTLRIGIIGAGAIVRQRHLPGLANIDGVEIVAICNRTPESTRRTSAEYGIPRTTQTWTELVAMDDLDVIWIGTTPYMHCPITLAALDAGKHVFCQARMAMDLDEARRMVIASNRHQELVLRFCPPPFGMGGDRVMRRLLHEEQFVGEVRQIELVSATGALLDPAAPLTWRLQKAQSGQNVFTLGIYFEVIDRWLGPTRRIMAMNRAWTRERIHPETGRPAPVELPESVNVMAELECGAIGRYTFSGVCAHAPSDFLAIYGTRGTIIYHFNGQEQREQISGARQGDTSLAPIPISREERRLWTVEADFIRAVRGQAADDLNPDAPTAMRYMALIDAVHRSAALDQAVDIPVTSDISF